MKKPKTKLLLKIENYSFNKFVILTLKLFN